MAACPKTSHRGRPVHISSMRLQLASDLHLEHLQRDFPRERLIRPAAGADLLVLAGDIHNGVRAVELFADWPVPVLYVAGNHESYDGQFEDTVPALKAAAMGTSVIVLDNDVADLRALAPFTGWAAARRDELAWLRFLGCTLWTDYCIGGDGTQDAAADYCAQRLTDHRLIGMGSGRFLPAHALERHRQSRQWLEDELSRPFDGCTVVVTHHGPHPNSIHTRYAGDPVNAGFVSDLSSLLPRAHLWLHGHVHDSFDYSVKGCRVVANPLGYASNRSAATSAADLRFQNGSFAWSCTVDTDGLGGSPPYVPG